MPWPLPLASGAHPQTMRALHSTRKASSDVQVLSRARSSNPSGGNPSFGGRVVLEGQRYRFVSLPYPGWSQTPSWYQDETSTRRTAVKTFRRVSCFMGQSRRLGATVALVAFPGRIYYRRKDRNIFPQLAPYSRLRRTYLGLKLLLLWEVDEEQRQVFEAGCDNKRHTNEPIEGVGVGAL